MCIYCGWPVPKWRPSLALSLELERRLTKEYIRAHSLDRSKKRRPITTVGVIRERREIKNIAHREPLSFRPKPKRPLPLWESHQFIPVSSKYLRWQHLERKRKHAVEHDLDRTSVNRQWVLDDRNKDGHFFVRMPPQSPLDRFFCEQANILARWWRCMLSRMLARKLRGSRVIQRSFRVYIAKTSVARIKRKRAQAEENIKRMFMRRYRLAMREWYFAAVKQRNERAFAQKLKRMFSNNWEQACFDALRANCELEKQAANKVIHHFHHWTFVRFQKRMFCQWYDWYAQQCNIRSFVEERMFKRWRANVHMVLLKRKQDAEYAGAVGFQRAYRGHRGRTQVLMIRTACAMDHVEFLKMRTRQATKINNRARIYLSHRRFDSRRCVRHVISSVQNAVMRKVDKIEYSTWARNCRRLEELRLQDEDDHVVCEIRRAIFEACEQKEQDLQNTVWGRLKSNLGLARKAEWYIVPEKILGGMDRVKQLEEAAQHNARRDFRKRWPPPVSCLRCHVAFAFAEELDAHVCGNANDALF